MSLKVTFPGGVAVNAEYKGQIIHTDQPREYGGGGTAPAPFDLFLASIGTCAGFYALRFCQERSLPTAGLGLEMSTELDPETRKISTVRLDLRLPDGFPEKYRGAILRAVDQCAVKRHIAEPPRFEINMTVPEEMNLEAAGVPDR
jgi:ribosomal protein S12 methylthiotransferase accessory factor